MGPDPAQEQCHPAGANPLRLPWAQQSQPSLASWWRKPVVKVKSTHVCVAVCNTYFEI